MGGLLLENKSESDTSLSHSWNDSISLLSQANLKQGKVIWAAGRIGGFVIQCCGFFYDDSPFISILVSFGLNPRPFLLPKLIFIEIKLTNLRFILTVSAPCPHVPFALGLCTPFRLCPVFPIMLKPSCLSGSSYVVSSQREWDYLAIGDGIKETLSALSPGCLQVWTLFFFFVSVYFTLWKKSTAIVPSETLNVPSKFDLKPSQFSNRNASLPERIVTVRCVVCHQRRLNALLLLSFNWLVIWCAIIKLICIYLWQAYLSM